MPKTKTEPRDKTPVGQFLLISRYGDGVLREEKRVSGIIRDDTNGFYKSVFKITGVEEYEIHRPKVIFSKIKKK